MDHGARGRTLANQAARCRRTDPITSRASRTAFPVHRSRGAFIGPPVVGGVCHRGNSARARARGRERTRLCHADCARHRRDSRHCRLFVSADDSCVPKRRRRVHRGEGQHRRDARACRRGSAAHRLCVDRRGEYCGGCGSAHVGVSRVARQSSRDDAGIRSRADARQPARHSRLRSDLCASDLPVRRESAGPHRHRRVARGGRHHHPDPDGPTDSARRRGPDTVSPADGILERLHGDDGCRGGLQRCSGFQAT
jgi:hypothetical protein